MARTGRSDRELAELAHRGDAAAFAVLVARHAPPLAARIAGDDPERPLVRTFARAMRRLRRRPPDGDVGEWLADLCPAPLAPAAATGNDGLDQAGLDRLWRQLEARWPSGRRPRRPPRVLRWAAALVVLASLGVLVPYLALTALREEREPTGDADLVARPYEADAVADDTTDDDPALPDFELPDFNVPADPSGSSTGAGGSAPPTAPSPTDDGSAGPPEPSADDGTDQATPSDGGDPSGTEPPGGDGDDGGDGGDGGDGSGEGPTGEGATGGGDAPDPDTVEAQGAP